MIENASFNGKVYDNIYSFHGQLATLFLPGQEMPNI